MYFTPLSVPLPVALATLPALSDAECDALLHGLALTSLHVVFARVPDARQRRSQRYDLAFLLTCLAAALLCGCNSTHAARQ